MIRRNLSKSCRKNTLIREQAQPAAPISSPTSSYAQEAKIWQSLAESTSLSARIENLQRIISETSSLEKRLSLWEKLFILAAQIG